ncbi:MAG: CHC2 zinc finger domain-containing protein, partial [Gammaproteobacteria bacterium]
MAKVDFGRIKEAALSEIHRLVAEWLPDGRREGNEWVARNPNRHDEGLGSFKVNTSTGVWADFATNDRGGDPISLLAYINNCSQLDAAKDLARQLGIDTGEDAPPSSRPSAPARRDPPPSESA